MKNPLMSLMLFHGRHQSITWECHSINPPGVPSRNVHNIFAITMNIIMTSACRMWTWDAWSKSFSFPLYAGLAFFILESVAFTTRKKTARQTTNWKRCRVIWCSPKQDTYSSQPIWGKGSAIWFTLATNWYQTVDGEMKETEGCVSI